MLLVYDWQFLHVCNLQENLLFSTLILVSVFSDCVVFYGDTAYTTMGGLKRQQGQKLIWCRRF